MAKLVDSKLKALFLHPRHSRLKNTEVIELIEPEDILPAYEKALNRTDGVNTILVEFADFNKEK